jgi:glutaminyl-tRNA synthetase
LFNHPYPDTGNKDFKSHLNPHSKQIIAAYLEPSLLDTQAEQRFQFERHGYFVADRIDTKPGKPIFNRAVTLRDTWEKIIKEARIS